jgi:glutamine synthetase
MAGVVEKFPPGDGERISEEVGLETADKQSVLQQAEENNVQFIRLWFTDVLGTLKSFAITVEELEDALDGGMGFDGSSITGYQDIEESDMIAMPDPSTFQVIPWSPQDAPTARMICDVRTPDGDPYVGDRSWSTSTSGTRRARSP